MLKGPDSGIVYLSRRDFIKAAGLAAGSALLAACAPEITAPPTVTKQPDRAPTSTPLPKEDTQLGGLPCEITGPKEPQKVYDEMLEALATAGLTPELAGAVLQYSIPMRVGYQVGDGLSPFEYTEYVAIPPLQIGDKQTEDQFWMRMSGGQFERLRYVNADLVAADGSGTVDKGVAWVEPKVGADDLDFYDSALSADARAVVDGRWVLLASSSMMVFRPPQDLLDEYQVEWPPVRSCMPRINSDVSLTPVAPTRVPESAEPHTFKDVMLVAYRRAPRQEVELQVDGYIKDLDFKETSKIENYRYGDDGPLLNVSINVDKTAGSHGIHEVIMPAKIAADRGIDALRAIFAPDMDRDKFIERLTAVQNGDPDVDNLFATSSFYDANKHTSKPEEMTLTLGGGKAEIAEGSVAINQIRFVYGEWYENPDQGVFKVSEKYPWFNIVDPAGGGSGVLIDRNDGAVYVFVGFPYLTTEKNRQSELGTFTEVSFQYIQFLLKGKHLSLNSTQSYYNRGGKWVSSVTVQ